MKKLSYPMLLFAAFTLIYLSCEKSQIEESQTSSPTILRNLIYYPHGPAGVVSDLDSLAANPYYSNIILGQFHFNETQGTLTWNDSLVSSQVSSDVWDAVRDLSQGPYPKIVSIQLGSAGNGTWTWIAGNMEAAAETLINVINAGYGIQGIDLDPEPIGAVSAETVYNFTLKLGSYKDSVDFYISHVPVPGTVDSLYNTPYWPVIDSLVEWVTPQWYGTTGNSLVSTYEQFISDNAVPAAKLVAGQLDDSTSPPSALTSLTSAIGSLNQKYSSAWGGVGIWAYPLPTSPNWADSIYTALHGTQ